MKSRIPYTKPSITELEVGYATDAARNGWGDRCYDYIHKFEHAFAAHLGVKHAIATSSCTGALHMGLAALGVGDGDEVVVADTNWIASVAPIVHLGATPKFVDVRSDTWCLDPERVERAIGPRTKAILAVHIYGNLCDMDRLLAIGEEHGIPVVEDAAEALGSVHRGRPAGSIGAFSTFSFHGTKTITTGEGGMFATNDSALYEKVLTLSNHGRSRTQKKQFWPDVVGFKYKMSNVQAAIGCGQIERIGELVARKREILAFYKERLEKPGVVDMNPEPAHVQIGAWMPTVVFAKSTGVTREKLQAAFAADNIDARVFFHALSSLDVFESHPENEVAWDLPTRAMNLPSYHDLTEDELERVVDVVKRIQS